MGRSCDELRVILVLVLLCATWEGDATRLQPWLLIGQGKSALAELEVMRWFSKASSPKDLPEGKWNESFNALSLEEFEEDVNKSGLHATSFVPEESCKKNGVPCVDPTRGQKLESTSTTGKMSSSPSMPVVQMHGMGDFAVSPGMVQIRRAISQRLNGAYVKSVKVGLTPGADMRNTFFTTMDAQVDYFAKEVTADANLKNGFNAVGYSQGNLVIRGYVERYNDPPVHNFISMHGILLGVSGFPQCNMSARICRTIDESLGDFAYSREVQHHLAQANYFRDPMRIKEFLKGDLFLADVNNDGAVKNHAYAQRFASLNKLVLVKAGDDTVVVPSETEWFGFYEDGSLDHVLSMNETVWYKEDRFGLKTLDEAGKIDMFTTPGEHLKFTLDFLLDLVDTYFKASPVI